MNKLDHPIVVVTGSSRGFGYALVVEFAHAGARVAISSRDMDAIKRAVGVDAKRIQA